MELADERLQDKGWSFLKTLNKLASERKDATARIGNEQLVWSIGICATFSDQTPEEHNTVP